MNYFPTPATSSASIVASFTLYSLFDSKDDLSSMTERIKTFKVVAIIKGGDS